MVVFGNILLIPESAVSYTENLGIQTSFLCSYCLLSCKKIEVQRSATLNKQSEHKTH